MKIDIKNSIKLSLSTFIMYPLWSSFVNFIFDSIDTYTIELIINLLSHHMLVLNQLLIMLPIFIFQLTLLLIQTSVLPAPAIHPQRRKKMIRIPMLRKHKTTTI